MVVSAKDYWTIGQNNVFGHCDCSHTLRENKRHGRKSRLSRYILALLSDLLLEYYLLLNWLSQLDP